MAPTPSLHHPPAPFQPGDVIVVNAVDHGGQVQVARLGVAAADDNLAFIKIDHAKASTTAALAEMTNRFLSVEALVEVRGTKKRNPL
jgi:hypothetical protein